MGIGNRDAENEAAPFDGFEECIRIDCLPQDCRSKVIDLYSMADAGGPEFELPSDRGDGRFFGQCDQPRGCEYCDIAGLPLWREVLGCDGEGTACAESGFEWHERTVGDGQPWSNNAQTPNSVRAEV